MRQAVFSAFCLSSGGQAAPKAPHSGGQAMIEFTVALVVIMAIAVGMILLNRLAWAHIQTMTDARAKAGALALDINCQGSLDAKFITDWETGSDNIRYTHDDDPLIDATAISRVGNIVANARLDMIATLPTNALTILQSSPNPIGDFRLVKGKDNIVIDLSAIPGAGRLFTTEPSISVESEAWLAWTEGIY